jgi:hypothetical protein
MLTEANPQESRTRAQQGVRGRRPEWPADDSPRVPPGKSIGFTVEGLVGLRGIREAYQTATDTWVGAD